MRSGRFSVNLSDNQKNIDVLLEDLKQKQIVKRIWEKDHTVWNPEPDEILNRLGWLESPQKMAQYLPEINAFIDKILSEGFTSVLLMGMGGSSLAPEVFSKLSNNKNWPITLRVIDSTHPEVIKQYADNLEFEKTLFIASTKSGGTIETLSLLKYFYNLALEKIGKENVGEHFTAITDPGSGLEQIAQRLKFRKIFLNDPDIGGRYSALSFFGIVPAGLAGWDISKILKNAAEMSDKCKTEKDNPGLKLGAIMGALANSGRDKMTLVLPDSIKVFGGWIEQLIAESTGKNGKGVLPVISDGISGSSQFSNDRYFIFLQNENDISMDDNISNLQYSGFPTIEIGMQDVYSIGGQLFLWEFATAVTAYILGVHPFDQPNVESAKLAAKKMMSEGRADEKISVSEDVNIDDNISVAGSFISASIDMVFDKFFQRAKSDDGSYVSIQAYLNDNSEIDALLKELRSKIENKHNIAVTFGYGPRFLHSTGQLHKGGAGNGYFIQLAEETESDLPIPDDFNDTQSSITFGTLINAQSLGDMSALLDGGRKVVRIKFSKDSIIGLKKINSII